MSKGLLSKKKFISAVVSGQTIVNGQDIKDYENRPDFVKAWEKYLHSTQRAFGCRTAIINAQETFQKASPHSLLKDSAAASVFYLNLTDEKLPLFIQEIADYYAGTGHELEETANDFLKKEKLPLHMGVIEPTRRDPSVMKTSPQRVLAYI